MAANNIDQHTNHNYRLRGTEGLVLRSSRMMNQNNCMGSRSLRRNIISNHFTQPYTQKFDDGTCDYDIARESELKSNNLQYHFRPQNMEEQLGYGTDYTHSVGNSSLDKMYNLNSNPGPLSNSQLQYNPNLNFSQSMAQNTPGGYPVAYGGNISGNASGVMGNFNNSVNHGPNYEAFDYAQSGGASPSLLLPQSLVQRPGGNTNLPFTRNFGQLAPNANNQFQSPQRYNNNDGLLSYRSIDLNRPFDRSSYPRDSGVSLQENFQGQPRNGWYDPNFFFDSKENYISVLSGDQGYSKYSPNPRFTTSDLRRLSQENEKSLMEKLNKEKNHYESNISNLQSKLTRFVELTNLYNTGNASALDLEELNSLPKDTLRRYLQVTAQLDNVARRGDVDLSVTDRVQALRNRLSVRVVNEEITQGEADRQLAELELSLRNKIESRVALGEISRDLGDQQLVELELSMNA